jgi:prolyl-tRNA synthetase
LGHRLEKPVKLVADREVAVMADWICGANEADFHITGVNWGRDLPEPDLVADLRNVVAGDPRRTARVCWRLSAALKWAMCSTWAPNTARP